MGKTTSLLKILKVNAISLFIHVWANFQCCCRWRSKISLLNSRGPCLRLFGLHEAFPVGHSYSLTDKIADAFLLLELRKAKLSDCMQNPAKFCPEHKGNSEDETLSLTLQRFTLPRLASFGLPRADTEAKTDLDTHTSSIFTSQTTSQLTRHESQQTKTRRL